LPLYQAVFDATTQARYARGATSPKQQEYFARKIAGVVAATTGRLSPRIVRIWRSMAEDYEFDSFSELAYDAWDQMGEPGLWRAASKDLNLPLSPAQKEWLIAFDVAVSLHDGDPSSVPPHVVKVLGPFPAQRNNPYR
jgi:hypothetical protein